LNILSTTVLELLQSAELTATIRLSNQLELPIEWTPEQQQGCVALYHCIVAGNQRMNLTKIVSWQEFLTRHVLESLLFAAYLPQQATVVDVGTGGGFPTLPLLVFRSDLTVVAIESVKKKARFVQETAEALGAGKRLKMLAERCEIIGQDKQHRQQYHWVISRAVANLTTLSEYCLPLLKPELGTLLAMKGPSWPDEYEKAETAIELLGGAFEGCLDWEEVPELAHCYLLKITKEERTPKQYPRLAGSPLKQPLGWIFPHGIQFTNH
jgi:16S rRNA (guanine527-N7)-methyltransferase